jgi:hypothetical protein
MFELSMRSALPDDDPAVVFKQCDDVAYLHRAT